MFNGSEDLVNVHKIIEPDNYNHSATDCLKDIITKPNKYAKVRNSLIKRGVSFDKVSDLLMDVYVSLMNAENDGECFDADYSITSNCMVVEQFVIGRLYKYAKNSKYSKTDSESGTTRIGKESITVRVCAASFSDSNDFVDNNDSFQRAYANASSADQIAGIDDLYSIKEQVDYCIDVCNLRGIKLINVLKNIDKLAELISNNRSKNGMDIFDKLRTVALQNEQFAAELVEVINFSANNRPAFEKLLATY